MAKKKIYKVQFQNRDQVYEVFVKQVFQGDIYGFVVLEDFVFGESSAIVVDTSEEKLKAEFSEVHRSFIPLHQIIRIDQVEKRGTAKIVALQDNQKNSAKTSRFYTSENK